MTFRSAKVPRIAWKQGENIVTELINLTNQELYLTLQACFSILPWLQERASFCLGAIFQTSTSHLLDHYELQAWFMKSSAEKTKSVPMFLKSMADDFIILNAYAQHKASTLLHSPAQILQWLDWSISKGMTEVSCYRLWGQLYWLLTEDTPKHISEIIEEIPLSHIFGIVIWNHARPYSSRNQRFTDTTYSIRHTLGSQSSYLSPAATL